MPFAPSRLVAKRRKFAYDDSSNETKQTQAVARRRESSLNLAEIFVAKAQPVSRLACIFRPLLVASQLQLPTRPPNNKRDSEPLPPMIMMISLFCFRFERSFLPLLKPETWKQKRASKSLLNPQVCICISQTSCATTATQKSLSNKSQESARELRNKRRLLLLMHSR